MRKIVTKIAPSKRAFSYLGLKMLILNIFGGGAYSPQSEKLVESSGDGRDDTATGGGMHPLIYSAALPQYIQLFKVCVL